MLIEAIFFSGYHASNLGTDSFHIFRNKDESVDKVICYAGGFRYKIGGKFISVGEEKRTVYLLNNRVISIYPKQNLGLDLRKCYTDNDYPKRTKFHDFSFYYNETEDRISEIVNSQTSLRYRVSYINDDRGNWVRMIITPNREMYDRIKSLKEELALIIENNNSYSSIDKQMELYKVVDGIKKELDDNYKPGVVKDIEKISKKVIIERNISYYD